jgi:Cu2+-exporting ATPase
MSHAGPARPPSHAHDAHTDHDGGAQGAHGSHDQHAGHSVAMFRDRFWLSVLLTIPVLVWSEMVQDWLGFTAPTFPLSERIPAILGTIVFVYGGMPFLRGGVRELRDRQPGMMLLISLAILVAFVASVVSEFGVLDLEFWWELALLIDVMLLGHWQEMKALGQASSALEALAALLPDEADVIHGDMTHTVPVAELGPGDLVLVRPGGRVPADGTVVDGSVAFDESMITGESKPVAHGPGDRVVAGTVATDGAVRIRVEAVGDDTTLAGIQRLVGQAQASRSRAQALADRAAAILFYVAVTAGVLTFVVWSAIGETGEAVERAVTVLVISCPHALGLAIPLVIAISTGVAARAGIMVKDRLALERMRTVDAVLFDKTGTLTRGAPVVREVAGVRVPREEVLRLAAAVEANSEHPLARAIVDAARANGEMTTASAFRSAAGRGVAGVVGGSSIEVGGPALVRERGLGTPDEIAEETAKWQARGATVLTVLREGRVIGALALEDEIRPESLEAIRALHAERIRVVMITGDAREVAEAVAPGSRLPRRDGRRRGQRRARAREGRRRHRDRRRDRRRDRVGGRGPSERRSAGRGLGQEALEGGLSEDGGEPRLGRRLQRGGHPPRGGGVRVGGRDPATGRGGARDERLDDHRRDQRDAAPAHRSPAGRRATGRGVDSIRRRDRRSLRLIPSAPSRRPPPRRTIDDASEERPARREQEDVAGLPPLTD